MVRRKGIMRKLKHVAIIADGNRRWARREGYTVPEGHMLGFKNSVKLSQDLHDKGIHTVTFWLFSTENWNRSSEEIEGIMLAAKTALLEHLEMAERENLRLFHIGRKDRLPAMLMDTIRMMEEKTKSNTEGCTVFAIDYGGFDEILRAVKGLISDNVEINEQTLAEALDVSTLEYPSPDILVRTSGEQRISNFMIWELIGSFFAMEPKYFPEVTIKDLEQHF